MTWCLKIECQESQNVARELFERNLWKVREVWGTEVVEGRFPRALGKGGNEGVYEASNPHVFTRTSFFGPEHETTSR